MIRSIPEREVKSLLNMATLHIILCFALARISAQSYAFNVTFLFAMVWEVFYVRGAQAMRAHRTLENHLFETPDSAGLQDKVKNCGLARARNWTLRKERLGKFSLPLTDSSKSKQTGI